ncbi:MAG: ASKHA domain-containing protein [Synergistaceae bacterium]|jgi:uncharacterized 2Fe-2S/4Fe-4S cluster protein (DUF4445 family)|nr:ASKHA domain-containing protein [Synergistaceae bacterium]
MTNPLGEGRGVYDITLMPEGKVVSCSPGDDLSTALAKEGIFLDSACGGAGTCGKCKIRVLSASLPATDNERRLLSEEERARGWRLACRVVPSGDMVIETADTDISGPAKKPEERPAKTPHRAFGAFGAFGACGLAVDVGTTTVEANLIDLKTGEVLAGRSEINPQTRFGLDVLSRISYVMGHPGGVGLLQKEIVGLLDTMTKDLCRAAGASPSSIGTLAVAANCTLLHLLLGVDPAPLGAFPFTPVFVEGRELPAGEIGMESVGKNARLYCLPSVSAFVGGDIVAGIYASGLSRQKNSALLIDIGTNGEMVLSREGVLACCSCAAGPALEGMNIHCGMRAADGAIEDVFIDEDEGSVRLKTIGDQAPAGICGSGILAAIKEFLRVGLVRGDGSLVTAEELSFRRRLAALCREEGDRLSICLSGDVVVTQKDVRQVQLAKGALLSGVRALLDWAEFQPRDIGKVFVAGQFGAHLPAESLTKCGILPAEFGEKIEYIGNSSLSGARMALASLSVREKMEALAHSVTSLELSATPGYSELFMKCLEFPQI